MLGFDGEITTHITGDSISRHSASCDGVILSAGKGQVFIGMDVTLFIGRGIFFYIAFGFAIAGLNALQSANTNRSTNAAATGLGFFCCLIAVFCSRDSNILFGLQIDIFSADLASFDLNVFFGGFDSYISTSLDLAALCYRAFAMAFCMAMTASDTYIQGKGILSAQLVIFDFIRFFPILTFSPKITFFTSFVIQTIDNVLLPFICLRNLIGFLTCLDSIQSSQPFILHFTSSGNRLYDAIDGINGRTTDRDRESALLVLMLFIAVIYIIFTGNIYIFTSHGNIFPSNNVRCIHVYVFIRFDGYVSCDASNSRTLLRHISVSILIVPFLTADSKS